MTNNGARQNVTKGGQNVLYDTGKWYDYKIDVYWRKSGKGEYSLRIGNIVGTVGDYTKGNSISFLIRPGGL